VARLAAKQETGVAPHFHYITANCPSMTHLRNAARAIFGPPGICKQEGLATAIARHSHLIYQMP